MILSPIQNIATSPERSYDESMNDLKTLLNLLPYKLAAYDAQGSFSTTTVALTVVSSP